jgi:hypothetical protein
MENVADSEVGTLEAESESGVGENCAGRVPKIAPFCKYKHTRHWRGLFLISWS